MADIRIGVVGGSRIAERSVLPAILATKGLKLVGIASKTRGEKFSSYGVRIFDAYEKLIESSETDALYISLPPSLNEAMTVRALKLGKHVLAEKPAAISWEGARDITINALMMKCAFLEGLMYRYHPQQAKVKRIIESGEIGHIQHVESAFGIPMPQEGDFRLDPTVAGGALNDLGIYPISFLEGWCGHVCARIFGVRRRNDGYAVDLAGSATAMGLTGITGTAVWGFGMSYRNDGSLWGSQGMIHLERLFTCPENLIQNIFIQVEGQPIRSEQVLPANHFLLMVEHFRDIVHGSEPKEPDIYRFLDLAETLQRIRSLSCLTPSKT